MPSLQLQIGSRMGCLLDVLIGPPRTSDGPLTGRKCIALLDVGAQHSSIDRQIAQQMGLQAISDTNVVTPTSPEGEPAPVYAASLAIEAPGFVSELPSITLTGTDLAEQGFVAIIGRDVLSRVSFFWNGPAKTVTMCL